MLAASVPECSEKKKKKDENIRKVKESVLLTGQLKKNKTGFRQYKTKSSLFYTGQLLNCSF